MRICITGDHDDHAVNQWSFVLSHWSPDELFILGDEAPASWRRMAPFKDAVAVSSLADQPGTLVVAAPSHGRYYAAQEALSGFDHPDDATYFFGSDHRYLTPDMFPPNHRSVYVPTQSADDMYSWVAAAVVLYDRAVKCG